MNQESSNMAVNPITILLLSSFGFIFLQKAVGELSVYDKVIEKSISKVASPLNKVSLELKDLLNEVEIKKAEVNRRKDEVLSKLATLSTKCLNEDLNKHFKILKSWDFDSCVVFTDDLNKVADIVWEAGLLTNNLTAMAGVIGSNILNCPTWTAKVTAECYRGNLLTLKSLVADFKNSSMPLAEEGATWAEKMRADFDSCIGIPMTSKFAIEQQIKNC